MKNGAKGLTAATWESGSQPNKSVLVSSSCRRAVWRFRGVLAGVWARGTKVGSSNFRIRRFTTKILPK